VRFRAPLPADQRRRAGTQKVLDPRSRLPQVSFNPLPLVKAQMDPPLLLDVRLGDQIKRVRAVLVMGAVLGDGKSNDMLCGRVMSSSRTMRLSELRLPPQLLPPTPFSLDKLCSHRTSHKGSYV
jgi:hypothetical protein